MLVHFNKYQGAGNDFVLVDNRNAHLALSESQIKKICDRRFGIGADGLMLLDNHSSLDFQMKYYNSDGRESTMCGNGGRCITAFAKRLGIVEENAHFQAIDAVHESFIDPASGIVRLKMNDVHEVEAGAGYFYLNTGSPHFVTFVQDVKNMDVFSEGRKIRYNQRFKAEGTNVNFVENISDAHIFVRTYERGVEDETYSCGTGVTASAISTALKSKSGRNSYDISTLGGELKVSFEKVSDQEFKNIWLEGPATFVFEGNIEI